MNYRERITAHRDVMLGKPVIKGTRITVELILQLISEGATFDDLVIMYPHITKADILCAVGYAAAVIAEEEMLELAA
jgi:uncharacterized protein (DUF433 family)